MNLVYISPFVLLLSLARAQSLNSTNGDVCQRISTVYISLQQVYQRQGLYVTVVPDDGIFRLLDNLCVTAFPIPGSQGLYMFYSNVVLTTGDAVETYSIAEDIPPGTFRRANPDGTISQRFFSNFEDSTLACTQFEYGDNPSPPLFAVSFTPNKTSDEDVEEMEDEFRSRGFQNVSLRALPMLLPTQCVLDPPCATSQNSTCRIGNDSFLYTIARFLGIC